MARGRRARRRKEARMINIILRGIRTVLKDVAVCRCFCSSSPFTTGYCVSRRKRAKKAEVCCSYKVTRRELRDGLMNGLCFRFMPSLGYHEFGIEEANTCELTPIGKESLGTSLIVPAYIDLELHAKAFPYPNRKRGSILYVKAPWHKSEHQEESGDSLLVNSAQLGGIGPFAEKFLTWIASFGDLAGTEDAAGQEELWPYYELFLGTCYTISRAQASRISQLSTCLVESPSLNNLKVSS